MADYPGDSMELPAEIALDVVSEIASLWPTIWENMRDSTDTECRRLG